MEDQRHTYEGEVFASTVSDQDIIVSGLFMMFRDSQMKKFTTNEVIFRKR